MTTRNDLVAVGIRLIVFYLIVSQLGTLPVFFKAGWRLIAFHSLFLLALFGLWISASFLANVLLDAQENNTHIPLSVESIEIMLIVMLGLFLVLNALPSMVYSMVIGRETRSVMAGGGLEFTPRGVATLASSFLRFVFGGILVCFPIGISSTLKRIQKLQWIKH